MVSRWALAPVAASGEATKPGLAPNGSLNQQSLWEGRAKRRERGRDYALSLRCGTLLQWRTEPSVASTSMV